MGLGKAQKQQRNLEAKQAKRREEGKKFSDMINSLDDDKGYAIKLKDVPLMCGATLTGRHWKLLYDIKSSINNSNSKQK